MRKQIKKAIIVGASSGIGYEIAERLAARGIHLGLAARRLEAIEAIQHRYPDSIKICKIDITNSDSDLTLRQLIDDMGGIDTYIHVAGIGYDNPSLDPKREAEIANTNAVGFARLISSVYHYFRNNDIRGHIAAVTSIAGTKGIGTMSAYSASKAFDTTYLTALRQLTHIDRSHITITDIRPGWTRTPLLHDRENYMMEMPLDYVANRAVRAILSGRRVAIIDWRWRIVTALWRLLPNCIWTRINPPT